MLRSGRFTLFLYVLMFSDVSPQEIDVQIRLAPQLFYVGVDGALQEAIPNINLGVRGTDPTSAGKQRSIDLFSGKLTLGFRWDILPGLAALAEFENEVVDRGANVVFGTDRIGFPVEQAYVDISELLEGLSLRVGIQDLQHKLRVLDEPFFLDLTESESFFQQGVAKDVQQPVGLRIRYDGGQYALDMFHLTLGQESTQLDQEDLSGLIVEGRPMGELIYAFGLITCSRDPEVDSNVWTMGIGVDAIPTEFWELYTQGYLQWGETGEKADKKDSYALQVGTRFASLPFWAEIAYAKLSGDGDPDDGDDTSFQSFEDVDRFLIVQDNYFGLDLDTNISSYRFTLGCDLENLFLCADVGVFRLEEPLFQAGEVFVYNEERRIGKELDLSVRWEVNPWTVLSLKVAYLGDSKLLSALTEDTLEHTHMFMFSTLIQF